MTKYKKLTRSTFAIVALCLALVGILAFGGTYAYFSQTGVEATGTATTASIKLTDNATTVMATMDDVKVVPGAPLISEAITATVTTDVKAVLIAKMSLEVQDGAAFTVEDITFAKNAKWTELTTADTTARYFIYSSAADSHFVPADNAAAVNFTDGAIYLDNEVGNGAGDANMSKTITMTVQFFACQYDYLDDANGKTWGDDGKTASALNVYNAAQSLIFSSDLVTATA